MHGIFGKSGDKYQPPIKQKFTLNILSRDQLKSLPLSERKKYGEDAEKIKNTFDVFMKKRIDNSILVSNP